MDLYTYVQMLTCAVTIVLDLQHRATTSVTDSVYRLCTTLRSSEPQQKAQRCLHFSFFFCRSG